LTLLAVIVRRVVEARRQSALNPFNPNPYSHNPRHSNTNNNNYPYNSPNASARNSIMNLTTKENALKAIADGAQSPDNTAASPVAMMAMARTPALAPPTADEEKGVFLREKEKRGESTRLDGRPARKTSVLGRSVGLLARLRCWGRVRRRERR
jgi:hypothetical protein